MSATTPGEIFAVDFATLAREIAMDIFPVADILELHKIGDEEWSAIQKHPTFVKMLQQMLQDWNAAEATPARIKAKASTGLETTIEVFIRDISNPDIPLGQRVEAGKFLAKLGEIGERAGADSEKFSIVLNIAEVGGANFLASLGTTEGMAAFLASVFMLRMSIQGAGGGRPRTVEVPGRVQTVDGPKVMLGT